MTDEIMLGCEAENKVAAAGRGVTLTYRKVEDGN
jgi:hypothetical protein